MKNKEGNKLHLQMTVDACDISLFKQWSEYICAQNVFFYFANSVHND